jgi:putative phosphotransacetylase
MQRPIPVDIIPSHVYLSQEDQATLFGVGYPMTILANHSQAGQFVYDETVEVFGRLKRSVHMHVLGPNWERSHVEISPIEAQFLGLNLDEVKTGRLETAAPCRLVGPQGEVNIAHGMIVPSPHLTMNLDEADRLNVRNGEKVSMLLIGENERVIDDVIVRVHPTFRLRVELHQGYARDFWLTRPTHARLRT